MGYHHASNNVALIDGFTHHGTMQKARTASGKALSLPKIDRKSLQDDFMITSKESPLIKDGVIVHLDAGGVASIRSYGVCPLAVALLRPVQGGRMFVVVGKSEDNKMIDFPVQSDDIVIIDMYSVIHNEMEAFSSDLSPLDSLEDICNKVHQHDRLGLCVALRISMTDTGLGQVEIIENSCKPSPTMNQPQISIPKKINSFRNMIQGRAAWFQRAQGKWKVHYHDELRVFKGRNHLQFVERVIMSNRNAEKNNERMICRYERMGCDVTPLTALILDGLAKRGAEMARDNTGKRMAIPVIDKRVLELSAIDSKIPMFSDGIIVHLDARGMILIRSYGVCPLSVVVLRVTGKDGFKVIGRSEDDRLVEKAAEIGDVVLIGNYWILQDDTLFSKVGGLCSLEELCLKVYLGNKIGVCVALRIGTDLKSADHVDTKFSGSTGDTGSDLLKSWFNAKLKSTSVTEFGNTGSPFGKGVLVGKGTRVISSGKISQRLGKFGIRTSGTFLLVTDGFCMDSRPDGLRRWQDIGAVKVDRELLLSTDKFKAKLPLQQHGMMAIINAEKLMVRLFGNPPLTAIVLRPDSRDGGFSKVLTSEPDRYKEMMAKDGDVIMIISNDISSDVVVEELSKDTDESLRTILEKIFKSRGNQRGMIMASDITINAD